MQQERESQTIYFKDLLFRALYRWKAALVVGVIFAIMLGGFGMLKSRSSVNLNTVTLTPEMEQKIELLRSNIERTEENIARQEEYIQNSLYLQINAYGVYTAGFHMVIYPESMMTTATEANAVDNTAAIVRAYQSVMNDTAVMEELAKSLDMQAQYLAELIYFDLSVEGTIGFSVRGSSPEEVQKIADAILVTMQEKQEQISRLVEDHTVKFMPFASGPKMDNALLENQNNAYQKLTNQTNNLASMESELKRMEPTALSASKFSPPVLAVIGGILGVGLTACCAWVVHICGAKVYSAKALSGSAGIRVLGCIPGEKKYDPVTKWLRKLEGRSGSVGCEALAGDIRNRCQEQKNLLIAGRYAQSAVAELTETLTGMGIQCTLCGTTEDPAFFEALPECDAVLLVETCMQSCYDGVQNRMQTIADYCKPLLGCVLIDG